MTTMLMTLDTLSIIRKQVACADELTMFEEMLVGTDAHEDAVELNQLVSELVTHIDAYTAYVVTGNVLQAHKSTLTPEIVTALCPDLKLESDMEGVADATATILGFLWDSILTVLRKIGALMLKMVKSALFKMARKVHRRAIVSISDANPNVINRVVAGVASDLSFEIDYAVFEEVVKQLVAFGNDILKYKPRKTLSQLKSGESLLPDARTAKDMLILNDDTGNVDVFDRLSEIQPSRYTPWTKNQLTSSLTIAEELQPLLEDFSSWVDDLRKELDDYKRNNAFGFDQDPAKIKVEDGRPNLKHAQFLALFFTSWGDETMKMFVRHQAFIRNVVAEVNRLPKPPDTDVRR